VQLQHSSVVFDVERHLPSGGSTSRRQSRRLSPSAANATQHSCRGLSDTTVMSAARTSAPSARENFQKLSKRAEEGAPVPHSRCAALDRSSSPPLRRQRLCETRCENSHQRTHAMQRPYGCTDALHRAGGAAGLLTFREACPRRAPGLHSV
jgi:hypothetical protein